ncbi:MAG: FUSC family protein [Armatimonadetes bacterium]|nr:FUSC family protein [Armatimonadota bacterium]
MWKTGVAVAASLAVCRAFNIPEPVFAGVAAVICVQPTVLQSFRKGAQRLQATVIGALVGLGMIALVSLYPLPYVRSVATAAAVILVMWLCLVFSWLDALVLAAATVVVIMVHSEEAGSIVVYAGERTLVTAVGVVVASLVNVVMPWPRVEDRFSRRLPEIAEQAFDEFETAVRVFCRRDLAGTKAALERWQADKPPFELASAELSWFQESIAVKQVLPYQRSETAPLLAEIFFIIDGIHNSARDLLEDTRLILEEHPEYVLQDSRVYRIIEDALEPAVGLKRAIIDSLKTGDASDLTDSNRDWTAEIHAKFISSMRAAHKTPRDLFPLFEVAKVGIELRNYTRMLVRLRSIILDDQEVLASLQRHRFLAFFG